MRRDGRSNRLRMPPNFRVSQNVNAIRIIVFAISLCSVLASSTAEARGTKKTSARAGRWRVAAFVLNGTEARLPSVPAKLVTFRLPFNGDRAAAAAISYVVLPDVHGFSLELEGQGLQHFGGERIFELAAAAVIRSPQIGLTGGTSGNVAWGNGFSYALTPPTAELGRGGIRGVDTVQWQYHMSFEVELTSSANSRVHYVARLHHRSGIYGLISPSRTGSNYIGLGLRFDLNHRGTAGTRPS